MIIKPINGKWTVNGKCLSDLTKAEREILNQFFKDYKKNEKSN
jgi:hypothetical protein